MLLHKTCVGKGFNATSELFAEEKNRLFQLDFYRQVPDFPVYIPNFSRGKKSIHQLQQRRFHATPRPYAAARHAHTDSSPALCLFTLGPRLPHWHAPRRLHATPPPPPRSSTQYQRHHNANNTAPTQPPRSFHAQAMSSNATHASPTPPPCLHNHVPKPRGPRLSTPARRRPHSNNAAWLSPRSSNAVRPPQPGPRASPAPCDCISTTCPLHL